MDQDEAIRLIKNHPSAYNQYRLRNPNYIPDFFECYIEGFENVLLKENGEPTSDLFKVDFRKADLRGAEISGAVGNANFSGADICGADLRGLTHIKDALWKDAVFNEDTLWPLGFDPIPYGAIYKTKSERTNKTALNTQVFISYAWGNEGVVLAIDQWLREHKNIQTKIDKRDFFAGSRIRDEIVRTMSECNTILIIYSHQSKDKPWPEFERELASDLEMEARQLKKEPPRIIYINIDNTPFPTINEKNRLAIMAKGKRFPEVCEEIYHSILQIPKKSPSIDLSKFDNYTF